MENLKNMNIRDLPLCRFNLKSIFLNLKSRKFLVFSILLLAIGYWLFVICFSPPADFPLNKIITIEKGDTLKIVAKKFEERRLIRSAFWFEATGWILMADKKIKAGEYFFEEPLSAISLIKNITSDSCQSELIKITIPEGFTLRDIGFFFENRGMWQAEELWEITGLPATSGSMEGFLFPDTYYVPLNISPAGMADIMRRTFDEKIAVPELQNALEENKRSLVEIITMASLLEKEAATEEDRKLIAGILWKRIDAGMPLQVDAVFPYIIGKHSLQLTTEDLKTDSPYNTYLRKGLPPGPIANPGIASIDAALNPAESKYWYYLSDRQGNVYYSATHEEHLIKKGKYLK